jgi:hypothetical protein
MKNIKLKLFALVASMLIASVQAAPRHFDAGTPPISKIIAVLNSCFYDFDNENGRRRFASFVDEILEIVVKEQHELLNEVDPKVSDKKAFLITFAIKLEAIKNEKNFDVIRNVLKAYFAHVPRLTKEFDSINPWKQATLKSNIKRRLAIA